MSRPPNGKADQYGAILEGISRIALEALSRASLEFGAAREWARAFVPADMTALFDGQ